MLVRIKTNGSDAFFDDKDLVSTTPVPGDANLVKMVPRGWRLVRPDETLEAGDLIAYEGHLMVDPLSIVVTAAVGYWGSRGRRGTIQAGERYDAACVKSDLWRLIRRVSAGDWGSVTKDRVAAAPASPPDPDHDRLYKFFFGKAPAPAGTHRLDDAGTRGSLPDPPASFGRSWDDLADG